MKNRLLSHNMQTIYGVILGAIVGFFAIEPMIGIADVISEIAVKLMKLIATPLLFLSIVSSAAHFKNFNDIKQLGLKIVKYTLFTTFMAAFLAEGLFHIFKGRLLSESLMPKEFSSEHSVSFFSTLLDMIPSNFIEAFLSNNVMAVVLMAIALALAILSLKQEEKEQVFGFFVGLLNAIMKMVHIGLKLIPLMVFGFVTKLFAQMNHGEEGTLGAVGMLTVTVVLANLLQGLVFLPIFLKYHGISPFSLLKSVKEALILAFFTRSSAATLPVTLDLAIKKAGIREDVAKLSLPLCTTINMNGCAQFILLSVYFVAAHAGHPLPISEHIAMILVAVLAAVGNAGVPMGCFFLASSILVSKDIPIYLMGSILPFYTIIDMVETSLNVWSDVSVTKVVDKTSSKP